MYRIQPSWVGGTSTDTAPFTATRDANGKITSLAYAGNTDSAEFRVSTNITVNPYADSTTTTDFLDILNSILTFRNNLEASDPDAVATTQKNLLLPAQDKMSAAMARNGNVLAHIELAKQRNDFDIRESQLNVSRETSADIPSTIVEMKSLMAAYEAATKIYPQIIGQLGLLRYL